MVQEYNTHFKKLKASCKNISNLLDSLTLILVFNVGFLLDYKQLWSGHDTFHEKGP